MKYNVDQALALIEERGEKKRRQKHKAQTIRLGSVTAVLGGLLLAFLANSSGSLPAQSESPYGAFLLAQASGGYILVAVVMFVLGAGLTLLMLQWANSYGKRSPEPLSEQSPDQKEDQR